MDFGALIPDIAKALHVAPSTLVFVILCVTVGSRALTRRIPNDASGWLGVVRQITAILGAETPTTITKGVTVADVAKASLETPPIPQKVEANAQADAAPIEPNV